MVTVRVSHNIPVVTRMFEIIAGVSIPENMERDAEDAGLVLENTIKKYIPAMRLAPGQNQPSSGRLWASFGHARPEFTNNPEFNPDDAIFKVTKRGHRITVNVGTKVSYASAVNDGFPVAQKRKVFLHEEGRYIWVTPFYFPGYNFIERGTEEARPIILKLFTKGVVRALGLQSFRATAQRRNILGRFTR